MPARPSPDLVLNRLVSMTQALRPAVLVILEAFWGPLRPSAPATNMSRAIGDHSLGPGFPSLESVA
eukprot:1342135-Amphidinium_carterae.1